MLRRCHFRFPISNSSRFSFPIFTFAKHQSCLRFCSVTNSQLLEKTPQIEQQQKQVESENISSSTSSSPSLSLLQTFTQPGKIRQHPLRLLADFAETELRSSLFQHQQQKDNETTSTSSSSTVSVLPIEEIQIVTADAARRVAQTLRNVAAGDDDQDTGVSKTQQSFSSSSSSNLVEDPLSFDSETLTSSIIDNQNSVVGAANLAEEQRRFEEVQARIFGSGLIEEWVDTWEKDFVSKKNNMNKQIESTETQLTDNDKRTRLVFDEEALLMNSMNMESTNNNNQNEPIQEIPSLSTTAQNNEIKKFFNNNNNVILNTSSPSASALDKQLPSVITLLQRHIIIASLISRFDAAVQAFMLLAQIRQHVNIVVDSGKNNSNNNNKVLVNIEVLTWRNLRDVVSSCAKQGQYETAESLVRFVLKKIIDAAGDGRKNENNNSVSSWPGITQENLQETLEKMVPSQTMTSLAKCIKSAKDLQRFRELMAIEGQSNNPDSSFGSLTHIPVSSELYTELINACSRTTNEPRRVDFALMFHRAIGDNGLISTPETFAALMGVFASRGSPTEAFSMFHEAKSKCSSAEVAACPALYNRLIDAYCQAGKLHDCIATTNILMENGAPITRRGFHAAMMSCAVQGDYGQCQSFLRIMQGNAKNVRTTIGVGERIGLLNHGSSSDNSDLYYSATNPSLFYSIPPTPTSLAIQLASLFFIRKSKELSWREKLTILGDLTNDAFSLLPLKEGEDEKDNNNESSEAGSKSFQRISLFCENEPFFCAILGKVLGESIVCPSLFDSFSPPQSAKNKQIVMKTNDDNDNNNHNTESNVNSSTPSTSSSSAFINDTLQEKYLYKKHVNLPVRILQAHAQQVLTSLLERAFERHEATMMMHQNQKTNDQDEQEQQQREYEFLENIISKASSLFAPQRPTRMPQNASVAALLPDVILNPSASIFTDGDDNEASSLFSSNANRSNNNHHSSESGQALLHLLQTILPTTTFFILPFASIQAIVAEFDALSVMNDYPLLQREIFESQLRRATSQIVANVDDRNKISSFEAKMSKALSRQNNNNNMRKNISSSDVAKLISTSNNRQQQFQRSPGIINNKNNNNSNSSLTTLEEVQDEKCSLSFHEKEYRLDKLSDAVLALAVFLHHHGDRVHVGSAMEDLDLSRCANAMRMKNTDAVQRAAANSIGTVFSALDVGDESSSRRKSLSEKLENVEENEYRTAFYEPEESNHAQQVVKTTTTKNKINDAPSFSSSGGDILMAVETSLKHERMNAGGSGNRYNNNNNKPRISRPLLNLIETYENQNKSTSSSTLYFDSRVNLNLVTCDIGLRRKLVNNNNNHQNQSNSKIPTTSTIIKSMKKLARDFDNISTTTSATMQKSKNVVNFDSNNNSTIPESRGLRNITGLGRVFSFQKQNTYSNNNNKFDDKTTATKIQQQRPVHSFGVRLVDPTKAIV